MALAATLLAPARIRAQIVPPPACQDATVDHERLRVKGNTVRFRVVFHSGDQEFHGTVVVRGPHGVTLPPSCTLRDAVDFAGSEFLDKAHQSLP